jgi:uncharacterized repeat protein (TIGR01451 family)
MFGGPRREPRRRGWRLIGGLLGSAVAAGLALGLASGALAQAPQGPPVYTTTQDDCVTGNNQFRAADNTRSWYTNSGCDSYDNDEYERPTNQGHSNKTITEKPPPAPFYLSGLEADSERAQGDTGIFSTTADYYEYVDITRGFTGFDGTWMYFRVELYGNAKVDKSSGNRDTGDFASGTNYNVRIANNADGNRANGGLLLEVQNSKDVPLNTWVTKDAQVWADTDNSVSRAGGVNVPNEGDASGYNQVRDNSSNEYLYVRRVNSSFTGPTGTVDRPAFEFAFNYAKYNTALGTNFTPQNVSYLVLDATRGLKGNSNYLWNDKYSASQAGSPNQVRASGVGQPQNIYELDTLRAAFVQPGHLELIKKLENLPDSQNTGDTFKLIANGPTSIMTETPNEFVGNDGTTGKREVDAGTYSVTEEEAPGNTGTYSRSIACYERDDTDTVGDITTPKQDAKAVASSTSDVLNDLAVAGGADIVCFIYNNELATSATLKLIKFLDPPTDPGQFRLFATLPGDPPIDVLTGIAGHTQSASGNVAVDPEEGTTFTIGEEAAVGTDAANYILGDPVCYANGSLTFDPDGTPQGEPTPDPFEGQDESSLTLESGDDVVCVFVNTRKTVEVTVRKKVVGGPLDADEVVFPITLNDTNVPLKDGESDTTTLPVGDPFTVSEDEVTLDERFALVGITCRQNGSLMTPVEGAYTPTDTKDITCKVKNEVRPTVTVKKDVIGAENDPTTFGATLTSPGDPDPTVVETYSVSQAGGPSDPPTLLDSGTVYTLTEDTPLPAGYEHQSTVCAVEDPILPTEVVPVSNQFQPQAGEQYRCIITNVKLPTLRVIKQVVNDNGGTLGPGDFTMKVSIDGATPQQSPGTGAPGTPVPLEVGATFEVTEDAVAGYQQTGTQGTCTLSGEGALPGGEYVCTIVNDDIAPELTVIKQVDGGPLAPGAFTMNVQGTNVSTPSFPGASAPGTTVTLNAGSYAVSEVIPADSNYTQTAATGCTGTLSVGQSATCTITNTYSPPRVPDGEIDVTPTPTPPVVRPDRVAPTRLAITKTAPRRARVGARFVYTVRVRNAGNAVARNVVLTDPLPRGLVLVRSAPRARVSGRTITVRLGNMRPGQVRVVRFTVRSTPSVRGQRVNVATARADNARAVRARAVTRFAVPAPRPVRPAVTG